MYLKLLVAQDEVMATFDTGLTIRQCLTVEIDSLTLAVNKRRHSQFLTIPNEFEPSVMMLDLAWKCKMKKKKKTESLTAFSNKLDFFYAFDFRDFNSLKLKSTFG